MQFENLAGLGPFILKGITWLILMVILQGIHALQIFLAAIANPSFPIVPMKSL